MERLLHRRKFLSGHHDHFSLSIFGDGDRFPVSDRPLHQTCELISGIGIGDGLHEEYMPPVQNSVNKGLNRFLRTHLHRVGDNDRIVKGGN